MGLREAVGTCSVGVDFALELDAALLRLPKQEQSILPIGEALTLENSENGSHHLEKLQIKSPGGPDPLADI